jgi:hypothetical protein
VENYFDDVTHVTRVKTAERSEIWGDMGKRGCEKGTKNCLM